ncbi:putative RNA-binding protein 18 isoform X5 [Brachyhypopomus gauderio]|uniref:putative RNA-binding protein 18 isoform X5 n=1 Tax=Brachyhypopomus gauderio TaxID=698409 RepID=UPI004043666D
MLSPMQSAAETVENASILSSGSSQEGHRLWIGNIDPKITEYHLVKLLEKFGKVKQFDFLFHKSGPLEGQPRGYCFVNFHTKEEAERAIQCLNGKLALSKKLVVRWAHAQVHKAGSCITTHRGIKRAVWRGRSTQPHAVLNSFSCTASDWGFAPFA